MESSISSLTFIHSFAVNNVPNLLFEIDSELEFVISVKGSIFLKGFH